MALETKQVNKKKTVILIVVSLVTVLLGVIAVVTALRLRNIGTEPVAPTAPSSKPQAVEPESPDACTVSFTITQSACDGWCNSDSDCGTGFCYVEGEGGVVPEPGTPGVCRNEACPTEKTCECPASPTPTPEPTPTPTPLASCNQTCDENADCSSGLTCDLPTNTCRNTACTGETDCVCPTAAPPTPTPQATSAATPVPEVPEQELPQAGVTAPTIVLLSVGLLLLLTGMVAILSL